MAALDEEDTPLLGLKQHGSPGRLRRYLTQNVRIQNAYIPLLICCFITGLVDAGSYNAWQVFMGMQIGNAFTTLEVHHDSAPHAMQAIPSSSP